MSKMLPLVFPRAQSCDAATFASLSLDDLYIDSLSATAYINTTVPTTKVPPTTRNPPSGVDVCILTINYTHPGNDDAVTTWVGLPLKPESWNGRFLMNGGGGWVAGLENGTISAVASGYTSASTNAGHWGESSDFPDWGLWSNGSVNWPALDDFASSAIVEAVYLGKQATELYYGEKPGFSYWNGCSTGGRQGHGEQTKASCFFSDWKSRAVHRDAQIDTAMAVVMAQQVPEEFDGILAGAPAINWAKFLVSEAWGYVKASEYGNEQSFVAHFAPRQADHGSRHFAPSLCL